MLCMGETAGLNIAEMKVLNELGRTAGRGLQPQLPQLSLQVFPCGSLSPAPLG
jgi:hypothetical protein